MIDNIFSGILIKIVSTYHQNLSINLIYEAKVILDKNFRASVKYIVYIQD